MDTPHKIRLGLRFKERDTFGNFCAALAADRVPFNLAGFQTVVLTQAQLEQLPDQSRRLFDEFKTNNLVDILPVAAVGKRHLPTPEEAKELFRKFAGTL